MSKPKCGEVFQERYLILCELGAGGMGLVFRARQLDFEREVALKLLRSEQIEDQDSIDRFYREFKLLSKLSHAHIMTLYALSLDEDSLPYAICEYLEGTSLRAVLTQEGPMPWQKAAKIAIQICKGMQYAHEQGVVHRDLKPDNIMLLPKPEPDFVKLVDFGLSRLTADVEDLQKLTVTGQLIGSANYMSPEIIKAKADERSDIYSLGCVIFEMLAGEYLFDAEVPVGVIFRHCNEEPSCRFKAIKGKIPRHMLLIMAKMLAKQPESRYGSMKHVAEDLQSLLDDPGETVLGSDTDLARAAVPKAKILLLAFALIALLILGTVTLKFAGKRSAKPVGVALSNASLGLPAVLPHSGASMSNMMMHDTELLRAQALGERWLAEHLPQSSCPPRDKIRVLMELSTIKNSLGKLRDQLRLFEQSEALLGGLSNSQEDTQLKYATMESAALLYLQAAKPDKAIKFAREVIKHCAGTDDKKVFFSNSQSCVHVLILCGYYAEANRAQSEFAKRYMAESSGDWDFRRVFELAWGDARVGAGDLKNAIHNYSKTIEINNAIKSGLGEGELEAESSRRFARVTGFASVIRPPHINGLFESRDWCKLGKRIFYFDKALGQKIFTTGIKTSPAAKQFSSRQENSEPGRAKAPVAMGDSEEWLQNASAATQMNLPEIAALSAKLAAYVLEKNHSDTMRFAYADFSCRACEAVKLMDLGKSDEAGSAFAQAGAILKSAEQKASRDHSAATQDDATFLLLIKDLACKLEAELAWSAARNGQAELVSHYLKLALAKPLYQYDFQSKIINAEIARVLDWQGDKSNAAKYWQSALDSSQALDASGAELNLAKYSSPTEMVRILLASGKVKEAQRIIASQSNNPENSIQERSYLLAEAGKDKMRAGKFDDAIKIFEEAHRLCLSTSNKPCFGPVSLPQNLELKLLIANCRLAKQKPVFSPFSKS